MDFFGRWLCGEREQCGHCDRMTICQMQGKTKIYERVHNKRSMINLYMNGEFLEDPLNAKRFFEGNGLQI